MKQMLVDRITKLHRSWFGLDFIFTFHLLRYLGHFMFWGLRVLISDVSSVMLSSQFVRWLLGQD